MDKTQQQPVGQTQGPFVANDNGTGPVAAPKPTASNDNTIGIVRAPMHRGNRYYRNETVRMHRTISAVQRNVRQVPGITTHERKTPGAESGIRASSS